MSIAAERSKNTTSDVICDRPLPTTNRSEFSKVQSIELCRDGVYKPTVVALQDYLIQCGLIAEMIQFSQESLK